MIAEGVAHHVTQRGNARRVVFDCDADRLVYLRLLGQYSILHRCAVVGYCLMSSHVHLIAVPDRADSLAVVLRDVHGRYATYLNGRQGAAGHVWQGRYFSCPLDGRHLWTALRYVERNPVRAGLAATPDEYAWSSAAAHCGGADRHELLEVDCWANEWTAVSWRGFLGDATEEEAETERIRRNTHTGRPLGSEEFVRQMERTLGRALTPQKGGRPAKRSLESGQQLFDFAITE